MTTNLRISYSDIPRRAAAITSNHTFADFYPLENVISGRRGLRAGLAAGINADTYIDIDMGSGNTAACDHIIIARADVLLDNVGGKNDVTAVYVKGDTTTAFGGPTTYYTDASFSTATLYGPRSHDYIGTFATSAAKRAWRIQLTKDNTNLLYNSQIYLGTFFDFGVEPVEYTIERKHKVGTTYRASSGAVHVGRAADEVYSFEFSWAPVSDAILSSFFENVVKTQRHHPGVFLHTTTNHQFLDDQRLVHCRLVDVRSRNTGDKSNYHEVRATFEEMVG